MFSINDDLKTNKTKIADSDVFETFDVFKDSDWALEYMESRPQYTRFNIKKHSNIAKEYTVSIVDRNIRKLQDQIFLFCGQTPKERGLFDVNYFKIANNVVSFTHLIAHNGYVGVIYIAENDDTFDLSKNLNYDVVLKHKTKQTLHTIQTQHNKLLLFDGNVFNLHHTFKGVDAKYNEYHMIVMYFN